MKNKKTIVSLVLMALLIFNALPIISYGQQDLGIWTPKASMTKPQNTPAVVTANGKIYLFLGQGLNVEVYDPATDSWTKKNSQPKALVVLLGAEVNGKIYTIGTSGGSNPTSIVEEYDPITDTWTTKKSMPTLRTYFGGAAANGKIYVIGGIGSTGSYTRVEEYNPMTDTWTTKKNMPTARYRLSAVEAGGKIYAIGGMYPSAMNVVEEYDPMTDAWTTKKSMPTARFDLALANLNGKVYAFGGKIHNTPTSTNITEEYDPLTDTWTPKANMLTVRSSLGGAAANGKIYAFGGDSDNSNLLLNIVEEFSPTAPTSESPINLTATAGNKQVDLSWNAVSGADSYIIKRSTTSGGPYTTIAQDVIGTSYTDTNVVNDTTYYYIVEAVKNGATISTSNEATATPRAPQNNNNNRALLRITMTNGTINEYDFSMSEVASFIDWYENISKGNGKAYYTIDKNFNIGPFASRKDYIVFDKISQFEVMEYTK